MVTLGELLAHRLRTSEPFAPAPAAPVPSGVSTPQDLTILGGPDRSAGCWKRRYQDPVEAETARQALLALGPACKSPETLHVYRCPHCSGWHVGHDKHEHITVPAAGIPAIRVP